MKRIIITMVFIASMNEALSGEMTSQDCKKFLPYHSYNVAASGICGAMLPSDVVNQHAYFRGVCTQKLGEKKSTELMKQGVRDFNKALSVSGQKDFCQAESSAINDAAQPKENAQALSPSNGSSPSHCEDLVATHGLLSRAQFQCGFNKYSESMMVSVKECYAELGEEQAMKIMKFGMQEFDRNENKAGHNKICRELLKSYPTIIAK